jgi:hypothetical protein
MPRTSQIHVDKLLSNVSVRYQTKELIALRVFPQVSVKKDSDLYRIYDRNFKLPETRRSNRGLANEHQFNVSTATYALEKHALKDYVSDDDMDNFDLANLRADTTEELTDVILRRLEKSVADLFTTTNWSLNVSLAAANAFNANTTVSNPIPIYDTAATTIINNSGLKPNFGILPRDGFVACKNHISVLDRVKYTSREMTPGMLGALFDLPELLIANGAYDTAADGIAATIVQFYGDVSFVGYKPPRASPKAPSSGYIFMKASPSVRRWRVEERESEAIEVQKKYQAKVVASLSGYLIKDIV